MEEIVLKYRKEIIKTISFSLLVALVVGPVGSVTVLADEDDPEETIQVTARVDAWIDFEIDDTDLELDPDLITAAGETNIGTASTGLTVGTSNPAGWTLQVSSENEGLYYDGAEETISSVSDSRDLAAGEAGYGISVAPNIGTPEEGYSDEGDNVGPVTDTATTFMTHDDAHDMDNVGDLNIKAAADPTTAEGDYTDEITITAMSGIE